MARPTKLTPETQKIIVDAVRLGVTKKDAAGAAGVAFNTLNEWMKKGEAAKSGKYHAFNESVKAAEADALKNFTLVVTKVAQGDDPNAALKAALAWLKAHDRQTWGENLDITSGGEKVKFVIEYANDTD